MTGASALTSLRTNHERPLLLAAVAVVAIAFLEGMLLQGPQLGPAFASLLGVPLTLAIGLILFEVQLALRAVSAATVASFLTAFFVFGVVAAAWALVVYPLGAGDPAGNIMSTSGVGVAIAAHVVWKRALRRG